MAYNTRRLQQFSSSTVKTFSGSLRSNRGAPCSPYYHNVQYCTTCITVYVLYTCAVVARNWIITLCFRFTGCNYCARRRGGFDSKQPNENPLQSTRAVKSVRCSLGRRTLFARLFRARLQLTIRSRTLLPMHNIIYTLGSVYIPLRRSSPSIVAYCSAVYK